MSLRAAAAAADAATASPQGEPPEGSSWAGGSPLGIAASVGHRTAPPLRGTPWRAPSGHSLPNSKPHNFFVFNQKQTFRKFSASVRKNLGVNQLCFLLNAVCLPSSPKDRWPVTHLTASCRTGGPVTAAMDHPGLGGHPWGIPFRFPL
jgi:hypothetical protein